MHLRVLSCLALAGLALAVEAITHGPWIGGVGPASATVMCRLDTSGIQVRLRLSTSPDLSASIYGPVRTTDAAATDNVVQLPAAGLSAGTTYYYGIELGGSSGAAWTLDPARQGSFRTFPAAAASCRIAFGSCSDWINASTDRTFSRIAGRAPDLFLHDGDLHYVDTNTATAADYWTNYKTVLAKPGLATLFRTVPTAYMWDDHDFCGNNSGAAATGRMTARAAYRTYVPSYSLAEAPGGAVYQAFNHGRVRVVMSDLRSEASPSTATDGPAKTRLGTVQKQWLKNQFLAARDAEAPLILWVVSMPYIGSSTTDGSWGAYATERTEIADFIRDNKVRNVAVVSGDMHALAYDDGTNSDYATGGGAPMKVFHGAALGRKYSFKGGPYTGGPYPAPSTPTTTIVYQYGMLDITDTGVSPTVGVAYAGYSVGTTADTQRLAYSYATDLPWPAPPASLTATPGPGQIALTWTDRSGVETGYQVESSADGATGWTLIATLGAQATSHVDAGLAPGTTRHYRVRAFHADGVGAYGAVVGGTVAGTPGPVFDHVVSSLADAGPGSLRQSMSDALAAGGSRSIGFAVPGVIALSSPLPALTRSLTIDGSGAAVVIDGGGRHRPFSCSTALVDLTLRQLTIDHGVHAPGTVGTVAQGGAISWKSTGTLTLDHVVLRNCSAVCQDNGTTATAAQGGAIYANAGLLAIDDTSIIDCAAVAPAMSSVGDTVAGGAAYITASARLVMSRCVLTGNRLAATQTARAQGGALCFTGVGGASILTDCTIAGNGSAQYGGGIFYSGSGTAQGAARLSLLRCTLEGNRAERIGGSVSGGGVYATSANSRHADLALVNCTIVGNAAWSTTSGTGTAYGGAISTTTGTTSFTRLLCANCTISGNSAMAFTAASGNGGGIYLTSKSGSSAILASSIIAGNLMSGTGGTGRGVDLLKGTSAVLSASHVLIGTTFGGHGIAPGINACLVGDPALDPPAANGGLTRTMQPRAGSMAIDAGSMAEAAAAGFDVQSDQRGGAHLRVSGPAADIGACEVQPPPSANG